MSDSRVPHCSACGVEIRWALTVKNKRMPLDATENPEGNVILNEQGRAEVLGPLERSIAVAEGQPLYMPHHATCPNADEFRKGKE